MIIAFSCAGFGFVKHNGMTFEVFLMAIIRQMFLYPAKRPIKSNNCFSECQEITKKEDMIRAGLNTRKGRKKLHGESMADAYRMLMEIIESEQKEGRPNDHQVTEKK
jgi:hypothetical protein